MSETAEIGLPAPASMPAMEAAAPTPLASRLSHGSALVASCGARTYAHFSDVAGELSALTAAVAVFDRGARVQLRISGEDRVRWLNGMVTNAVKSLEDGSHHYTFVLNAQGRIQGDATIFACPGHLILETDRAQAERLFAHLDRFIIMDDVELSWVEGLTALGLAGPEADALLGRLGLPAPEAGAFRELPAGSAPGSSGALIVVGEEIARVSRFSLWANEEAVVELWQRLIASGATPAGALAVDALRVLEGTPLYGVDITEKTLAQETGQMRALNFNKGCYLGQEIVERVRSRASVHRGIRQFVLHGEPAEPGRELTAEGSVIGELTSVAQVALPQFTGQVALAPVRLEALSRPLSYSGGTAEPAADTLLEARAESETVGGRAAIERPAEEIRT